MTRVLHLSGIGKGLNEGEPCGVCSPDAAIAESGGIISVPGFHCVSSGLPVWFRLVRLRFNGGMSDAQKHYDTLVIEGCSGCRRPAP